MRILITGRHVGVTEAMKEYAREKAAKLERIHERLTKIEVTMDVVHDTHRVEVVVDAPAGVRLVAKAQSPDMYAAVDLAEEKIARQLVRHKQRLNDHHRGQDSAAGPGTGGRTPGAGASPAPGGGGGEDETYDDVIDRMGED